MEPDLSALQAFLDEMNNRPLSDAVREGNRPGAERSRAVQQGAHNLLDKAAAALDSGDDAKLQRYVSRLCALPYDEHEQMEPGVTYAGNRVFTIMADFLEELADDDGEGEIVWFEAIESTWQDANELGREALSQEIAALSLEREWRFQSTAVADRVTQLAGGRDARRPIDIPNDQHASYIVACLTVAAALQVALDEAMDQI